MDVAEVDPLVLLSEIACAEERARTAREWGLLDYESRCIACGEGPQALINRSIVPRKEERKGCPPVRPQRKGRPVHSCPNCGHRLA